MIKSQIVVLSVMYEDDDTPKGPPASWDWNSLIDQPILNGQHVIASGPVLDHPFPSEVNDGTA